MNPYPLNACFLASPLHLMGEEMLGSWEQSFVRVKHISGIDKVLQALRIKAVFLLLNDTDRLHHWDHRR